MSGTTSGSPWSKATSSSTRWTIQSVKASTCRPCEAIGVIQYRWPSVGERRNWGQSLRWAIGRALRRREGRSERDERHMSRFSRSHLRRLVVSTVHGPLCALCSVFSRRRNYRPWATLRSLLCVFTSKELPSMGHSALSALCFHVEGTRAPCQASLLCRTERNRSHDDECHRPALECSCCSYLSAGNTRQVADTDEIFVMGVGEFSPTV